MAARRRSHVLEAAVEAEALEGHAAGALGERVGFVNLRVRDAGGLAALSPFPPLAFIEARGRFFAARPSSLDIYLNPSLNLKTKENWICRPDSAAVMTPKPGAAVGVKGTPG